MRSKSRAAGVSRDKSPLATGDPDSRGLPLRYARDLRPLAAIPLDAISSSLHRPLRGTPRCVPGPPVVGALVTGGADAAPAAGDPPSEETKAEPAEAPRSSEKAAWRTTTVCRKTGRGPHGTFAGRSRGARTLPTIYTTGGSSSEPAADEQEEKPAFLRATGGRGGPGGPDGRSGRMRRGGSRAGMPRRRSRCRRPRNGARHGRGGQTMRL
jgi:hypothetical protein